ncbi:hypothetical protein C0991_002602, partial [Blastosporella zonata]
MLTNLSKDAVLEAFRTKEAQRKGAEDEAQLVAAAVAAAARDIICRLCRKAGHVVLNCPSLDAARKNIMKDSNSLTPSNSGTRKNRGGRRGKANAAKTDSAAKIEDGCDGPATKANAT